MIHRFECIPGCALCCRGYAVAVSDGDIGRIKELGLGRDWLNENCTLRKSEDGCVFLKGDRCGIYDHRPGYCRSFPFYREAGGELDVDLTCPGVGRGPEVRHRTIRREPVPVPETIAGLPGFVSAEGFSAAMRTWVDSLRLPELQKCNQCTDLFDLTSGMNAHLDANGRPECYRFEVRGSTLRIGDREYTLDAGPHSASREDAEQIRSYLRVWFDRGLLYRFCLANAAAMPVLRTPVGEGIAFASGLTSKLLALRGALSYHWSDEAGALGEAIRALDGRLRAKLRTTTIQSE